MNDKEALRTLQRTGNADQPTLKRLHDAGYIEVRDVTSNSTPPGQRELLFTFFTEKAKEFLEG